jgi:NADH-quinone oxidoreductase subunit J
MSEDANMLTAIAFYVFSAVLLGAGFMTITARNPVHAVLSLILAFFTAAGLFVLLGAEFLAMLLVVVYVGAVAVLFLFVVMMLDIDFVKLRRGMQQYMLLGFAVGGILALELVLIVAQHWSLAVVKAGASGVSNTVAIGRVLYTDYVLDFQTAGLVLLTAMIGAIVLTLRRRSGVKHQSGWRQVSREPADCVETVDIRPGEGA